MNQEKNATIRGMSNAMELCEYGLKNISGEVDYSMYSALT